MPRTAPRARRGATTRAFFFSDLRDYTRFVETRGDAAAARLLREYRTIVRRAVARHRGAEVKTEGDSFYLVFDSPSSALDCAVAILRASAARRPAERAHGLRVGVGLHAGETFGDRDQPVGSAVNIASRLAAKADAGELLVSDTLRGLVRTTTPYRFLDRGTLRLKGVAERIRVWSVRWHEGAAVRRGLASDWRRLEPLVRSVGETEDQPSAALRERFVRVLGREDHALLVAEVEDALAGFAWAQDSGPQLRTGQSAVRVHDLFVHPEWRRRGIGRALLDAVREWAAARGARWLRWRGRPESREFYAAVGLRPVSGGREVDPLYELDLAAR